MIRPTLFTQLALQIFLVASISAIGCGTGEIEGSSLPGPEGNDPGGDPGGGDPGGGDPGGGVPDPVDAGPPSRPDAQPTPRPDAAADPDDGTGGGGGGIDCRVAGSWPAASVAIEDEILVLVNQHRAAGAACGNQVHPARAPLRMNAELREAARCHSLDMGQKGYFSHDSQDGRSPWDRIAAAGYTGSATGENISAGYGTAKRTVDGWMTSDGHCNNIMASGSTEIGVGRAEVSGSPFGNYATQTFGRAR